MIESPKRATYILKVWCHALLLSDKLANNHESRFSLFGLISQQCTTYMSCSRARTHDHPIEVKIVVPYISSAGVGRTGTYIAIDILLHQARSEKVVDFYGSVLNMREDRVDMIQNVVWVAKDKKDNKNYKDKYLVSYIYIDSFNLIIIITYFYIFSNSIYLFMKL